MRLLLYLLFLFLLIADTLGLGISLAPGLSVKNAFLYLILVSIAIEAALRRNRRFEARAVIVPYALCIFYAFFTWLVVALIVDYPGYSLLDSFISLKGGFVDHLVVFLAFFYGVSGSRDGASLLKAIIWTVISVNFLTVLDGLNLLDLGLSGQRQDGRIVGPIGESNQYAVYLAFFLPAALGLVMIEDGVRRKLAMLGFAASVVALLMTASRGGVAGVVGGAIIGGFYLRKFISAKVVASAIGGFVVLLVVSLGIVHLAGYTDLLYERFIGLSMGGSTYALTSGRTVIWGDALARMFEQPWSLFIGFGWDAYRQFPDFRLAPHNSYLKIFFELGIVGLSLVLATFASVIRIAREGMRHADRETAILLFSFIFGFIGTAIAAFFVDLSLPWIFFWAYIGIAMRLAVLQPESAAAPAEEAVLAGAGDRTSGVAGAG